MPKPTFKLMIATPSYGGAQASFVGSVIEFIALAERGGVDTVFASLSHNPSINRARNVMAATFLASDCTHLLFIDDDIGFEADKLLSMIERAWDEGKSIVGAPYPRRHIAWGQVEMFARTGRLAQSPASLVDAGGDFVFEPLAGNTALRIDDWVECAKLGSGLMCIARPVFDAIAARQPELAYILPAGGGALTAAGDAEATAFFHPLIEEETRHLLSDDYAFCVRARAAGFSIFAAPWIRTSHTGPAVFAANLPDLARLQSVAMPSQGGGKQA